MNVPADARVRGRWRAAVLVACATVPYVTVFSRDFTNWDDDLHVSENTAVQYPTPANLGVLVREPFGNFIPLTTLSYTADWQLYGGGAWGFAVTNAVLYAACCLLLVRWLRVSGAGDTTAWLAGVLFAVHPLHVEPVAWISGRKDLLCLAWLLGAHITYAQWIRTGSRWRYGASLALLVAAGLSKPAAMSACLSLWLYDVLLTGRRPGSAARSVVPHAVVCVVIAAGAFWSQQAGDALRGMDDPRWGDVGRASVKMLVDMGRCFVPVPYSPFYPADLLDGVPRPARWLAPVVLASVSAWVVCAARRSRRAGDPAQPDGISVVTFGWFASLCYLVPVSGIVPLGWTSIADRYLLIPSIASCVLLAWGVRAWGRPRLIPVAYALALGAALLVHVRARDWSDSESLWRAVLRRFPDSSLAWKNLAAAHYRQQQISLAARAAVEALDSVPGDPALTRNAAEILLELGRLDEAERLLGSARAAHPQTDELDVPAAKLELRRHQPAAARRAIRRAIERHPDRAESWLVLSYVEQHAGDLEAATQAAAGAVALAPRESEFYRRLIELHLATGRDEAALDVAREANRVVPHARGLWRLRRDLLTRSGRLQEAAGVEAESARFVRPPL